MVGHRVLRGPAKALAGAEGNGPGFCASVSNGGFLAQRGVHPSAGGIGV